MSLSPGTRLGPYEIVSPVGSGGMGEVYRARDTRLDRAVAVKVLAPHLASTPELKLRFEREARAVSSLNHPNICALYDLGHQDGIDYLVMEMIEGETLAARLQRGPMPLPELLRCATQVADAIDRAHRQGLLHRDLKPGNIMLTGSGAKLLDFGLAKTTPATGPSQLTATPTWTGPLTAQGAIVGTFQYMAPEQLDGKEADARSDIFAFGAVLYEMATGRRAFNGATQASLIASILKEDPRPITDVAPASPAALDRLIRTCLAKDPEARRQTMRDVLLDLKWIAEGGDRQPASPPFERTARSGWFWKTAAAAFFVATLVLAWLSAARAPRADPAIRLSFINPLTSGDTEFGMARVSPDGRRIAFVSRAADGRTNLWVRELDALAPRMLAGTDGAMFPFWSPDGAYLGFFAGDRLKKVALAGGPPQSIADAPEPVGGAWNRDGVILFARAGAGGLYRVAAAGGPAVPATRIGPREEAHRWPCFLPDQKHFVFLGDAARTEDHFLRVGSLGSEEAQNLFGAVTDAAFAPPDFLLYVRSGTLLAQRLDLKTFAVAGEPIPLTDHLVPDAVNHHFDFSVSANGVLAYRSALLEASLTWLDRGGRTLEAVSDPLQYRGIELSPDGREVLFEKEDENGRVGDVWTRDLQRGTTARLTFHPGSEYAPIWSPGGDRIVYGSGRADAPGLYRIDRSNPERETLILPSDSTPVPTSWSPDGRTILYTTIGPGRKGDLAAVAADGTGKPATILATPFEENSARFSPDGKWIAYVSDQSGRPEVYLQTFPEGAHRLQVSTGGGESPFWRRDGREIFYVGRGGAVTAAELRAAGGSLQAGATRELFVLRGGAWAVSADGERFLVALRSQNPFASPYTIVFNWTQGIDAR